MYEVAGDEPLNNPGHERMAKLMADGLTQIKAYVAAGYKESKSAPTAASTVANRAEFKARVAYLKEQLNPKAEDGSDDPDNYPILADDPGRVSFTNPLKENFCRMMALGYSAKDSYKQAGYTPNDASCTALSKREDVINRIRYLRKENIHKQTANDVKKVIEIEKNLVAGNMDQITENLGITEYWIISMLQNNIIAAQDNGQYAAANKALELLIKYIYKDNLAGEDDGEGTTKKSEEGMANLMDIASKIGGLATGGLGNRGRSPDARHKKKQEKQDEQESNE